MNELSINQIIDISGGMCKEYSWEDIGCKAGNDGMSCEFSLGQVADGLNDLGVAIGSGLYDLFN